MKTRTRPTGRVQVRLDNVVPLPSRQLAPGGKAPSADNTRDFVYYVKSDAPAENPLNPPISASSLPATPLARCRPVGDVDPRELAGRLRVARWRTRTIEYQLERLAFETAAQADKLVRAVAEQRNLERQLAELDPATLAELDAQEADRAASAGRWR